MRSPRLSADEALAGAERAAEYLMVEAERSAGTRARQGYRQRHPFAGLDLSGCPSLQILREERIHRVPETVLAGLAAWARGFRVDLREDVPAAQTVLRLQARGERCVSLLGPGATTLPFASGFDFAVHDLCHLAKFADPATHVEQVGFFHSLRELESDGAWRDLELSLDETFREERDRVGADTNGSSVYLFALLKMKLKMAARRKLARERGLSEVRGGPLTADEERCFEELSGILFHSLRLTGDLEAAAVEVSTRRDDPRAAALLAAEFTRRGHAVLAAT